jgi:hypothetical protein
VSYVLSRELEAKLGKPLPEVDKGVARILVGVAPDLDGEDRLFLRVVLKDDRSTTKPSEELGKRLQRIAGALRQRATKLGLPLGASIDFVLESELPPPKRKTA